MKKASKKVRYPEQAERINPVDGIVLEDESGESFQLAQSPAPATKPSLRDAARTCSPQMVAPLSPIYRDDAHGIWLYQGNCLSILDAIAAKHPDGCFDTVFADPPYFLSNGGITCHAGKMVKVDKGDWDKNRGPELNHEFNTEWLRRCQRVLKPNACHVPRGHDCVEHVLDASRQTRLGSPARITSFAPSTTSARLI